MSAPAASPRTGRATAIGLVAVLALMLLAAVLPGLLGWDVRTHTSVDRPFPPLHSRWDVKVGVGTVPAVVLAVLGVRYAATCSARLAWRPLLLVTYAASLAWSMSLALVDGRSGLTRVLGNRYEYLPTARETTDIPLMLTEFVSRIPLDAADNWPIHVAGHPPGALLFFVVLDRVGLGGDLAAAVVVTLAAASTAVAVLVALRALGAEQAARTAAPFLVLGTAAIWMVVSADGLFAAVAAWGLATLALAATSTRWPAVVGWSVVAGALLGYCVMMSYGLPLLGLPALAVLMAARSWWPLPVAVVAAVAVVLAFALHGFAWWEALPVLRERYWDGIASDRPASYWLWANVAALGFSAGPALGAALGAFTSSVGRLPRPLVLLVTATCASVLLADLSLMSKAEVERIWLPFVPWLLLATAALPPRWRRPLLTLQVVLALLVQHLLYTSW